MPPHKRAADDPRGEEARPDAGAPRDAAHDRSPRRHGERRPGPRAVLAAHLLADAILAKLLPRFAEAGIAVLPVKGVITSRQLYADASERPITDVDLRVPRRDVARVARLAAREGWRVLRHSRAYANVVLHVDGFAVDVEGTIGPPGLCALRVEDLLARAEPIAGPGGVAMRRPELHDHALVLVVNAFKDKMTRAAPWAIEDLARVAAQPGFDPAIFAARARAGRVATIASIVAAWMVDARACAAWRPVLAALGPPPRPRYARLYRALVERDDAGIAARLVARAGSDAPLRRARAIATALVWEAVDRAERLRARIRSASGARRAR